MVYYSKINNFVSACARIARRFSCRDARDALWNEYVNDHFDNYHITFSYGEGGSIWPRRLEFNVMNEVTNDHVSRVMLHVYDGDLDDLPIITSKAIERVVSSLEQNIYDDMEAQQE